ncbi:MAG TPA: ABC transporter substrate-binding protein [Methanobacterium sp.]|nr:ABC transporter substrate-binding protein [Methanobacterium sp.]
MENKNKIIITIILLIAVFGVIGTYITYYTPSTGDTKQITDMVGRNVTVPAQINTVVATSPPTTNLIYMLAPEKLAGWNFKPTGQYMDPKYKNLTEVGGWFGKQTGNYETFISINPDIVMEGSSPLTNASDTVNKRQEKFGAIPVVAVLEVSNVTKFTKPIKFMGQALGAEDKADKLISFYNKVYSKVNSTASKIPEDEKKKVYYAEGPEGLQTDPSGSQHSQLIELAGGINIADVPIKKGMGMSDVSMEQVLQWNPDVILVGDPVFYKKVYKDSKWQNVKAVKEKQVFLIPQDPLNWFDRPPGVNIILGIPWTAKTLYPDKFQDLDMESLTKEFYSEFYHYQLTDDQVNSLLNPQSS